MMYAKVIPVQLINMLGYDVLFQDVDIIWYKDPLLLFHDESSPVAEFDMMFQDDGARSVRYAPYSANSGFYYVRHNAKTRYAFTSLLYSGDVIQATQSHQQALSYILTEHSSLFGLKVKVLNEKEYPGGFHYHGRNWKDFMREIGLGTRIPTLFHMSWTLNKDNKVLFMKQMGMWYLSNKCEAKKAEELFKLDPSDEKDLTAPCCSAKPIISCHYSDKPSAVNCNDSPKIDKKGKPFWPK
uniref:Nucleotide-diphospho-sugar transferase domain-containing protein n=1 Tax=Proboscia inermis TaxID=420281 RepID=A0A7S0C9L0_9STRA|mmetsp:Transcript_34455/g.34646  ORF Transcript_34455/g.34646 Transcript_34455/m.34646 type:complete len:240 (+) Transcript_34455:778-1497(+)